MNIVLTLQCVNFLLFLHCVNFVLTLHCVNLLLTLHCFNRLSSASSNLSPVNKKGKSSVFISTKVSGGKVSQDMILSTSMNMLAARKGTGGVKIEIVFLWSRV